MAMRGIAALVLAACLAVLLTACGSSNSSSSSNTATTAKTTATTGTGDNQQTPDIEGNAIERLPQVPAATAATKHPVSPHGSGGRAFLTAVFNDIQAMWTREFEAAGIRYTPAR